MLLNMACAILQKFYVTTLCVSDIAIIHNGTSNSSPFEISHLHV